VVWKLLRDALSHWNVVNSDRDHRIFHEGGVMERLLFYRSHDDRSPWDVLSVSPDAFLVFLKAGRRSLPKMSCAMSSSRARPHRRADRWMPGTRLLASQGGSRRSLLQPTRQGISAASAPPLFALAAETHAPAHRAARPRWRG
jgi:hypothetical protein